MFDEKSLKALASIQADGPILSVYLNVDPTERTAEEYKLTLREMLKTVGDSVDEADKEAVKQYVDLEYDWAGRGLAVFSRQAEDIWHTFSLAVPVRSGTTVARRPYISPLVEVNGLYGRYVVALVDRQGGRFFFFQMGELSDQKDTTGEDIHRTRKGRGSSVVGMRGGAPTSGRREAELVQRNLKDIASALATFCQTHRPRHLLLAGSDRTLAQFKEQLPAPLTQILGGSFNADMDANEVEIRERSFEYLEKLMNERHEQLVNTVVTAAAKGQNGVVGLDETMSVAHEGRIQVLVVERDYHEPGYRCTGCGYLTTTKMDTCVFCGNEFTEIPDAVEAVVSQVVEKGGDTEVVDDDMMGDTHIGALLRY
jgi:hypothetical protein